MDAKIIELDLIKFNGRVQVSNAEKRALMRWFKSLRMVDLPLMARQHGGRYLVINGGAS